MTFLHVSPQDFLVIKLLGVGAFGKVYLVEFLETSKRYAMKVLSKTSVKKNRQVLHTLTERKVLSKNSSPFLVKLQFAFQTSSHLYMVMDLASGGELVAHIRRHSYFPQDWCQFYAAEVVSGLNWLHEHGIIYRDLKPENTLLSSDGHVLLADFGLCKPGVERAAQAFSVCGTPEYIAPEVLKGLGYDRSVDYWGLGVVLYVMLCGCMPFLHSDRNDAGKILNTITLAKLSFQPWVSAEARALVLDLLAINVRPSQPLQRLTSYQALQAHPFFAGVDWSLVDSKRSTPPIVPCHGSELDPDNFTYSSQIDDNSEMSADESENEVSGFAVDYQGFSFRRCNTSSSVSDATHFEA
jgi:serine/threonine protein kinase